MSLTEDDLRAVGDLFDRKFDEKFSPVQKSLEEIHKDIRKIKKDARYTALKLSVASA